MTAAELLSRPEGALVRELQQAWGMLSHGYTSMRIRGMVAAGDLFEGVHFSAQARRYFCTAAARDVWQATAGMVPNTAIQLLALQMVSDGRPYLLSIDLTRASGKRISIVSTALMRMVGYGLLHSVTVGRRHFYFATAQAAAEFSPQELKAKAKALDVAQAAPLSKMAAAAFDDGGNAPVKLSSAAKGRLQGEAIIPAGVRRTIAPTQLPRFHVPADFRGPFSQAGIGRYLDGAQEAGA